MRYLWNRFRYTLHLRGHHRLCREVTQRFRIGTDFGPEWLVGKDPDTGEEIRLDTTVFGGQPIYETRRGHG